MRPPCHFQSSFDDLPSVQNIISFLFPCCAMRQSVFFCNLIFDSLCDMCSLPSTCRTIASLLKLHQDSLFSQDLACATCFEVQILLCVLLPSFSSSTSCVLAHVSSMFLSWEFFNKVVQTRDCLVDRASIFRYARHANLREQFPSLSFHRRPPSRSAPNS